MSPSEAQELSDDATAQEWKAVEENCFKYAKIIVTTNGASLPIPIHRIAKPPKTPDEIDHEQRIWTGRGIVRAVDPDGPTDQERERARGDKDPWGDSLNQISRGLFKAYGIGSGINKNQDARDRMAPRPLFRGNSGRLLFRPR